MNAFLTKIPHFLAATDMAPMGEMGARYWAYLFFAMIIVIGGILLALSLWKKGKKGLAVVALLAELATAGALVFFAEGLRQPQEITNPGLPDVDLPDLPDLDLPSVTLPDSE